jgi:DNA-directed RNA polymerase specialized sigma24 family protein
MKSAIRRDALLQHLDGLYTLAQGLTLDAAVAVRLVERTYQAAFQSVDDVPEGDEKAWLVRSMMRLSGHMDEAPAAPDAPEPALPADYRRRLAEQFLDRMLPSVLVTLPDQDRLLLLLSDVEGMPCEEAARVLDRDEDETCSRLETARAELRAALFAGASEVEERLVHSSLPLNWLKSALGRAMAAEFSPVPPTLRASVAALRGVSEPVEMRPAPPVPPRVTTLRAAVRPRDAQRRAGRALSALVLIVVAGLVGVFVSTMSTEEVDTSLISLSARHAYDVAPTFRTGSPEQAERFVRDRLGWRLTVPNISDASLSGVGIREVAPGVEVPVFLYEEVGSGMAVVLYAYTYAMLDRFDDRISLERDILTQIQDDAHFDLHDLGDDKVLIWRHRDEILLAVTRGDAERLRRRIAYPS